MFNEIIDNLSRLEILTGYIPSLIQLVVLIAWIILVRVSKVKYRASLNLSLFLLGIAMLTQLINNSLLSKTISEYSFIFLTVGIVQMFFAKED